MAFSAGLTWEELKQRIGEAFAEDRVDVNHVEKLMNSYVSKRSDWEEYEHFDKHKYTRNLVDEGNGRYNLIVICWDSGQGSSIHDHADSHCFMKILRGCLKETQYEWPEEGVANTGGSSPMKVQKTMFYGVDDVAYINDSIGLHRVENHTHTDPAVSLHLYSPPIQMCQCFEERTGISHKCNVTFYSKE